MCFISSWVSFGGGATPSEKVFMFKPLEDFSSKVEALNFSRGWASSELHFQSSCIIEGKRLPAHHMYQIEIITILMWHYSYPNYLICGILQTSKSMKKCQTTKILTKQWQTIISRNSTLPRCEMYSPSFCHFLVVGMVFLIWSPIGEATPHEATPHDPIQLSCIRIAIHFHFS